MGKMKSAINLFWVAILLNASVAYSLEVTTHEAINGKIASGYFNGFSLDNYLKNNFGFCDGIRERVRGQEVWKLIRDGGRYEDKPPWTVPYTRSMNHFHNPLKTWDAAGFKGTFQSSVLWTQEQGIFGSLWGGDWSWKKARNSFHKALTGITKTDREENFADAFRAAGQLMHLVEDLSVPSHTRNDAHATGYHYELAVDKFRMRNDPVFADALSNPIIFDPSILAITLNPLAPIPIAKISDADKYNPANPDPAVTVSNAIGLSEYTNANFVSEGLISANFQDFPYPRLADTTIVGKSYDSSLGTYTRQYYSKNCCGETNSGKGYLLAVVDYLDYWRQKFPLLSIGLPKIPVLDDNVYKDYAALLIPRAVGYSAGLLNYFFRGTLEITAPDSYVYSIIDGSIIPQQFTRIKAKIRNTTPNEEIQGCDASKQNCILRAVARYKKIPNYSGDLSNYPPDGEVMRGVEYSYSVSAPITVTSLSSSEPTEFVFDFSSITIPAGITDLSFLVVFKGTLGGEQDIAVAVGMKDLREPTHHIFWNLTDMFSLNYQDDYHLYTSPQIKGDWDLASLVDYDHDGVFNEISAGEPYIDPYDLTFDIGYMSDPASDTVTSSAAVSLPSGRFVRLIVLVDRQYNYLKLTWTQDIQPGSAQSNASFEGVANQEVGGVWQTPTPNDAFRSISQHFHAGVLRCEPQGIDSTGQPGCPYPEPEAIPADLAPYPATINFP